MRGGANRAFWVLTAVAVVFLILFLVVSASMWNKMASIDREAQDAKQKLQTLQNEVEQGGSFDTNLAKLQARNSDLELRLKQLNLDLPQADFVPTLVKQLEQEAALTHNDVTEIRPGELRQGQVMGAPAAGAAVAGGAATPAAGAAAGGAGAATPAAAGGAAGAQAGTEGAEAAGGQRYDELDLSVRMRGSYQSVFGFLKRMANLREMLFMKSITLQRTGQELRPDQRAQIEVELQLIAYILQPRGGFPAQLTGQVFQ